MKKILYIIGILMFIDIFYLQLIGKQIFEPAIVAIQKSDMKINMFGAVMTYLLLGYGLHEFIIKENKLPYKAFILGLIIYGVFDMTNLALFKNYKLKMAIIDMIWGGVLFYITTIIYYKFNKN